MTPEHFVIWLTGFLKGMKFGNEKVPLVNLLEEQLKCIELDQPKYEVPPLLGCQL